MATQFASGLRLFMAARSVPIPVLTYSLPMYMPMAPGKVSRGLTLCLKSIEAHLTLDIDVSQCHNC